tara:strand:- start:3129 stop:4391 length:1263 start_codon:yes stop_codon:yes gene_type:complete
VKKKILLRAPVLTRSGYGEQSRFALRALRSKPEIFDIYIQPMRWGDTSWLIEDDDERQWIDQTIERTIGMLQSHPPNTPLFDISLQVTIPSEFENMATTNIGYTAGIEATQVHPSWLEKCAIMDKVITISQFSKTVFDATSYEGVNQSTGEKVKLECAVPVSYVNYPVKTYETLPDLELELEYDVNFLTVAQFGPRKNLQNTIKWFVEEFQNDEVGLVIKTNFAKNCTMDREACYSSIQEIVHSVNKDATCKVYLIHGDMLDNEIHALYNHPKLRAMLCLPHGEGFGLPMFEAAYSGMPVITVGWSGQLDYLIDSNKKEQFYNVSYDIRHIQEQAVWDGVLMKEAMWAFAKESSAKTQMRRCYDDILNNSGFVATSAAYAEELKERFSEEKLLSQLADEIHTPDPELDAWLSKLAAIEQL